METLLAVPPHRGVPGLLAPLTRWINRSGILRMVARAISSQTPRHAVFVGFRKKLRSVIKNPQNVSWLTGRSEKMRQIKSYRDDRWCPVVPLKQTSEGRIPFPLGDAASFFVLFWPGDRISGLFFACLRGPCAPTRQKRTLWS
jgi:hypothetical protein